MSSRRLDPTELAIVLDSWPRRLRKRAVALRDIVLDVAPEADEDVRFGSLCYFKPDRPYGSIGGNICMISQRDDELRLEFIHGAALDDPEGLLLGTAKAKRFVPIRSEDDPRRSSIRRLILAAVEHDPSAG